MFHGIEANVCRYSHGAEVEEEEVVLAKVSRIMTIMVGSSNEYKMVT
jgi:hypothetical protein